MRNLHRFAPALIAAPLMLALSACGSDAETGAATQSGEPLAAVAAPEGTVWSQTAEATEMGGFRIGNPDAPLELVEYASHTCPACANFANTADGELDKYVDSGVVSFELRNQIHDPLDLTFAILARCGVPEAFYPLAKQGWANLDQIRETALSDTEALNAAAQTPDDSRFQKIGEASGLIDWFAARGVSRDQALECLGDGDKVRELVESTTRQSSDLGVTGTPTFFLNGQKIETAAWTEIEAALQQAGAR